jgi:hypothetical protein
MIENESGDEDHNEISQAEYLQDVRRARQGKRRQMPDEGLQGQ